MVVCKLKKTAIVDLSQLRSDEQFIDQWFFVKQARPEFVPHFKSASAWDSQSRPYFHWSWTPCGRSSRLSRGNLTPKSILCLILVLVLCLVRLVPVRSMVNLINFEPKMKMYKLLSTFVLFLSVTWMAQAQQFKALLFTKTAGFHHTSIHEGVTGVRNLAARHNFTVDWQESADVFNEKNLAKYDVVIFLNTTGDILNDAQQTAFEKYIQSGKGWVGIHAAADTEYEWPWYTKLVGMMFNIHPAQQTAYLDVVNSNFPGLERFPKRMLWTDEWYEYQKPYKANDLKFLIMLDEKTYDAKTSKGAGMGAEHPIAWYHNYDGGRAFYTGMGHIGLVYSDQSFLDHLYGGIYWAATGKGVK
jgi:uncharacterized protein